VNHINEHSGHCSMRSKCPPPACTYDLRWSRQHRWCPGQSQSKFGSSIFAGRRCHESLFCCITPQISNCKAHDDSGPLWWSWYIWCNFLWFGDTRCITFSVFWVSQSSVATLIKWCRWSSYWHMCRSFVNLLVKTALKTVDFWQSYRPKRVDSFLWPTV